MSRSKALRRGIRALRRGGYDGPLRDLVEEGLVTPPGTAPGTPPPSAPVARFEEIQAELEADRRRR